MLRKKAQSMASCNALREEMFRGIGNVNIYLLKTVIENSNGIFSQVLGKYAGGYSFDDMEPIWMVASVVIHRMYSDCLGVKQGVG